MNRATSLLFWFALTIIVSVALYDTSYRVQDLRVQLRTLNAKIEAEQRNIHVLKAEWGFLTNPARIELAARKHLKLAPMNTTQIARIDDLNEKLPARIIENEGSLQVAHIEKIALTSQSTITPSRAAAAKIALDSDDMHLNTHIIIQKTADADVLPNRSAASLSYLNGRGATP